MYDNGYIIIIVIVVVIIFFALLIWWWSGTYNRNDNNKNILHNMTAMEHLWGNSIYLNRLYMIEIINNHSGAQTTLDKLNSTQDKLGGGLSTFYGKDVGNAYASLLKKRVSLHCSIFSAMKEGREDEMALLQTDLSNTNNEIGGLYQKIFKDKYGNASDNKMIGLMNSSDNSTINQAQALLNKDYSRSMKELDSAHITTISMSNTLNNAIFSHVA